MSNHNSSITNFLWNFAGFKKEVIQECKADSYHAAIIGLLLLMVGIYATFAWAFFFSTVFNNPYISIVAGLFMGLFIVSFDRALIASLSTGNGSIYSLVFRFVLAILLGIFLSQPMILKFYEPEIKREAQILVDKKVVERKTELEKTYALELNSLNERKKELEQQLAAKKMALDNASADFTKEMDGTGGSGRIGYSEISKKKEQIFNEDKEQYNRTVTQLQPELANIQTRLDSIKNSISANIEDFKIQTAQLGTLVQAEALESLMEKDKTNTLKSRYYLLSIILTLIELSALIAKLFFKTKSYTSKISFIAEEEIKTSEVNKEIVFAKLDKYKELSLKNELQSIDDFFEKSKPVSNNKLNNLMKEWNDNKEESHKTVWEKFRSLLLVHE